METLNRMDRMDRPGQAPAGRGGRIAARLLGALLIALVADLLLSLLVPVIGYLQILALRSIVFPPKVASDDFYAYSASATLWGGRLYTGVSPTATGVYALGSGVRLLTIPEIPVGQDATLLYTSAGARMPGNRIEYSSRLIARDSAGNLVWSHDLTPYIIPTSQQLTGAAPQPRIQSDAGSVYVMATKQAFPPAYRLVALDKATGVERWSYDIAADGYFVLAGGALVLLTQQDQPQLIALAPSDGRQLWRRSVSSAALATDGQALYLLDTSGLRVLAPQSGGQRWAANFELPSAGAAYLVDGAVVYTHDLGGQVSALRRRDGQQLWRASSFPGEVSQPQNTLIAAQGGVLYLLAQSGHLLAVDGASGNVRWMAALAPSSLPTLLGESSSALAFGVYLWCGRGWPTCPTVIALDQRTGKLIWSHSEPSEQSTTTTAQTTMLFDGQSFYLAALTRRTPVYPHGYGFSNTLPGPPCADLVSLVSVSAATGAAQWRHATTTACGS
jgi:outer membrane protein assembly factor BamB